MLVVAAAALVAPAAWAEARWYQLPANDVWVFVEEGWRVRADEKNPMLIATDTSAARFEVGLSKSKTAAAAVKDRQAMVAREYGAVAWKKTRDWQVGTVEVEGRKQAVAVRAVLVGGVPLFAVLYTPKNSLAALQERVDRLLKDPRKQATRPGGIWAKVPGSRFLIKIPKSGWKTVPSRDPNILTIRAESDGSEVRAHVDGRPGVTLASAIEVYRQALGGGVTKWSDPAPWRPPSIVAQKDGLVLRGVATMGEEGASQTVHLSIFAYSVPQGVALIMGSASPAAVVVIEETAQSFRAPAK